MATLEDQELHTPVDPDAPPADPVGPDAPPADPVDPDAPPADPVDPDAPPADPVDPDALGDEAQRRAQQEAARETEALMEERGKKLDKLGKYVAGKLVEIFGEEAADELELCELCTWTHTYGWRVPQLPPEPVRDAVKIAIGLGTIDELKEFPAFQTCETCNGLGNVRTGSQVTTFLFRQCPSCEGRGYTSALAGDADRPTPIHPIAAMPGPNGAPPQEPDVDMFGTPRGHPDYGKLAQHREVPISHWQDNLPSQ